MATAITRVLFLVSVAEAAFSSITPQATRSPTMAAPIFSGANLLAHQCLEDDRLDAVEAPCALPKKSDPITPPRALPNPEPITGLWNNVPKPEIPPPKGPSEFQINVGHAINTLRHDYPVMFTQKPDLSIFTKDVQLWDPSGKRLSGITQYSRVFDLLIFLRRTTMQDAQVTYRLVVADEKIRVRWSAKLWMRDPALGLTKTVTGEPAVVHLDGVSNYELDHEGRIRRHRLENIVLRGQEEMEPVTLAFAWPVARIATPTAAVPFFRSLDRAYSLFATSQQPAQTLHHPLQARVGADTSRSRAPKMSADDVETPMQRAARERAEDADRARRLREMRSPAPQGKAEREGLFGAFSMPQPCDTSYDCERPEVCCDLLFGSVCCSAGLMTPVRDTPPGGMLQRQAIPIPVERDNDGPSGGEPPSYP
eukprot:CAMPEP_0174754622 /NCGR_PEP_ID=MMETSP1094-20130205/105831_1 /TAXON_ID=156173 /ORGANISM="Chrysochromulina brevifilum, Strain UTEX LB 985" /LENGTH=422 /DNA_ID=CAMNT_0015960501 /DNA_START=29 /DNA_END=1297 /DNA_ORIENTATION=-